MSPTKAIFPTNATDEPASKTITTNKIILTLVVFCPNPRATSSLRLSIVSCLAKSIAVTIPAVINGMITLS